MEEETPYLMVLRGSQVVDVSLIPGETKTGYITPIVGVEGGRFIDFDRKERMIYWLQGMKMQRKIVSFIIYYFSLICLIHFNFFAMQ